jgi:hypothetical protein
MIELIAGAAVAVVALALVLEPLVHPTTGSPSASQVDDHEEEAAPLDESESPKIQALLALKEIEFDQATGKLSDEDYQRLKGTYSAVALAAIDAEDAAQSAPDELARGDDDPAEAMIRQAKAGLRICPECGPRPESDAAFCSDCGRALTTA